MFCVPVQDFLAFQVPDLEHRWVLVQFPHLIAGQTTLLMVRVIGTLFLPYSVVSLIDLADIYIEHAKTSLWLGTKLLFLNRSKSTFQTHVPPPVCCATCSHGISIHSVGSKPGNQQQDIKVAPLRYHGQQYEMIPILGSDVPELLRLFCRPEIRPHPSTSVPGSATVTLQRRLVSIFRVTLPRSTVRRRPYPCLGSHSIAAAGLTVFRDLGLPLFDTIANCFWCINDVPSIVAHRNQTSVQDKHTPGSDKHSRWNKVKVSSGFPTTPHLLQIVFYHSTLLHCFRPNIRPLPPYLAFFYVFHQNQRPVCISGSTRHRIRRRFKTSVGGWFHFFYFMRRNSNYYVLNTNDLPFEARQA